MTQTIKEKQRLINFYDSLNESQLKLVDKKVERLLGGASKEDLDDELVFSMKLQVASDMFFVLRG